MGYPVCFKHFRVESASSWRARKFLCFSLSSFAQQVSRLVHTAPIAILTRTAVWMASAEKRADTAFSILSAVRENAVTRMAIAIVALSEPQPL